MKLLNLVYKALPEQTVEAAANSPAVSAAGLSTLAFQLVVTDSDSPTGCSATLQRTLDTADSGPEASWNWENDGSATNITADGLLSFSKVNPEFANYRIKYAWASGSFVVNVRVLGKGLV